MYAIRKNKNAQNKMLKTNKVHYILKYLHVRNIPLENMMVHPLCITATFTTHEENSRAQVSKEKATVCKGFLLFFTPYSRISSLRLFPITSASWAFSQEQPCLRDSTYVLIWKAFPNVKWQRIVSAICCTSSAMNTR